MHAAFFGRTTLDVLYLVDALPPEDTKAYARQFHAAPGGPACNAAITHSLLGGRSTLISSIGKGPFSTVVRQHLANRGIVIHDLATGSAYETPLTTIFVNQVRGTRTILNPPQTAVTLRHFDPASLADSPDIALTDGFHLEQTLPALVSLAQRNCPVVFDGGSWKPGTDTLATHLTVAICSERFALPDQPPDVKKTLGWFADQGVANIAVTRGPRPILAMENNRRFEVAIPEIKAVDTAGAGDVLHGAFCYYFTETASFEQALRKAAEVASRSCRAPGIDCWTVPPGP